MKPLSFLSLCLLFCLACQPPVATDAPSARDWNAYGGDQGQTKFSPLAQLSPKNVDQLTVAWTAEAPEPGISLQCTPLVVKGRMYAYTAEGKIAALDPATGTEQWTFQPDSTRITTLMRSLSYWHHPGEAAQDQLLFVHGSTLYALRAQTGELVEGFGQKGKVDFYTGLEVPAEQEGFMEITANAPGVIFEDLYIVGCKVPDELPSAPGDIRAFDVHTGELVWTFHVIPKEGEFGYESWPPDARQRLGGANCWSGMALDEARGLVYVPTASPSFDFYGGDRVGMNLFANCLLALDARTGERKWHFQTTHHDLWDRDNASPPNLITIRRGDSLVDAVTLVTKLGYLFVFDRETGEPLFDIEERPVPTDSPIAGEEPWPTQPFPVAPPPFARQGFTPDRYTDRTPEARAFVEKEMAEKGYRTDIYAPPTLEGAVVTPAAHGGGNWGGASVNPETQTLFVNATDLPWFFQLVDVEALAQDNDQDGASLYQMYCAACHGKDQKGSLLGPDITLAAKSYPFQKLENVLLAGREPMPSFKHLPREQLQAIVFYLKGMEESEMAPESVSERSSYQAKYSFSGYGFFNDQDGYPAIKPPWGTLTAIDLAAGTIRWQVPLGEYPELTAQGLPPTGSYNRGGGIATAGGLLIIGATYDRKLRIFSQKTGELLWQTELPGASTAIPATYEVAGRQYLTLAVSPNREAGFNGGYMTFSLPE